MFNNFKEVLENYQNISSFHGHFNMYEKSDLYFNIKPKREDLTQSLQSDIKNEIAKTITRILFSHFEKEILKDYFLKFNFLKSSDGSDFYQFVFYPIIPRINSSFSYYKLSHGIINLLYLENIPRFQKNGHLCVNPQNHHELFLADGVYLNDNALCEFAKNHKIVFIENPDNKEEVFLYAHSKFPRIIGLYPSVIMKREDYENYL